MSSRTLLYIPYLIRCKCEKSFTELKLEASSDFSKSWIARHLLKLEIPMLTWINIILHSMNFWNTHCIDIYMYILTVMYVYLNPSLWAGILYMMLVHINVFDVYSEWVKVVLWIRNLNLIYQTSGKNITLSL